MLLRSKFNSGKFMIKCLIVYACVCIMISPLGAQDRPAMKDLIDKWQSHDFKEREEASEAILKYWDKWSDTEMELIKTTKEDSDVEVSKRAVLAEEDIKICKRLGKDSLKAFGLKIVNIIRRGDEQEQINLIEKLIKSKDDATKAYTLFCELLKGGHDSVKLSFLNCIRKLQVKEYAKDIVPLLKDENAIVRCEALCALLKLQATECAKDIVPLLKDEYAGLRQDAVNALRNLMAKEYTKEISELLNDPDPSVKFAAKKALKHFEKK